MDLDSVSDELYGLAPDEFTAARDARAREARPADRALAGEIHKLRRPSLGAFALNVFVRRRQDEIAQLLALGEELRNAQAALAGTELRALLAQRRQLVSAIAAEVRRLAGELGHPLNDRAQSEVARTLEAALADAAAAGALASGRLVTALAHVGLGGAGGASGSELASLPVPPSGAAAAGTPGAAGSSARPGAGDGPRARQPAEASAAGEATRRAQHHGPGARRHAADVEAQRQSAEREAQRQSAERALGEARLDARRARERVETAKQRAARAAEQRERARRHADSLAEELPAARQRELDAETAWREAGAALGLAEDEEREASRRADAAERELASFATS
ncbi:MAG TPA: hypothetical protein VMD59_19985 [Acidimicrobiales bacterium]|nr:hypothetical protein [Acidimicrobiales bacterium]